MSHFTVLVLTEKGTDEEVAALLAPYDENLEAPEYERPCYCVGRQAREEVNRAMAEKHGRWDDFRAKFHERADIVALQEQARPLRDEFYQPVDPVIANRTEPSEQTEEQKQEARKAMKARKKEIGEQLAEVEVKIQTEWEAYIKPRVDDEQAMFAAHPDREKPNPGCEECNGEGTTRSTYNPVTFEEVWEINGEGRQAAESSGYEILLPVRKDEAAGGVREGDAESRREVYVLRYVYAGEERSAHSRPAPSMVSSPAVVIDGSGIRVASRTASGEMRDLRNASEGEGASNRPLSSDREDSRTALHEVQLGAGENRERAGLPTQGGEVPGTLLSRRVVGGSKWDWYTVGGRWQGLLDGYDPDDDPENHETCWLCDGTGMRNDTLGKQQREKDPKYTCNGCQGTGKYPVFPSLRKEHSGDRMRVDLIKPGVRTYAMVTPDGEWHQRGEMGWFGISSNEMSEEEWQKKWDEAIAANADKIAVLVDCHI